MVKTPSPVLPPQWRLTRIYMECIMFRSMNKLNSVPFVLFLLLDCKSLFHQAVRSLAVLFRMWCPRPWALCVERPVSSVIKGSSPLLCCVTCALCDTRHSINQYQLITWYFSRPLIGPGDTLSPLVPPTRDSLILGLLERIVCFCSQFGWLCNKTYFRASGIFLKTLFCASHIVIFTL